MPTTSWADSPTVGADACRHRIFAGGTCLVEKIARGVVTMTQPPEDAPSLVNF